VLEARLESELVRIGPEGARALALTLLRATGMLSGVDLAYRPLPAGPPLRMEGPQLLRHLGLRYAVCVDPDVDPYALADDVLLPLEVREARGGGVRSSSGTELDVRGAQVSA